MGGSGAHVRAWSYAIVLCNFLQNVTTCSYHLMAESMSGGGLVPFGGGELTFARVVLVPFVGGERIYKQKLKPS